MAKKQSIAEMERELSKLKSEHYDLEGVIAVLTIDIEKRKEKEQKANQAFFFKHMGLWVLVEFISHFEDPMIYPLKASDESHYVRYCSDGTAVRPERCKDGSNRFFWDDLRRFRFVGVAPHALSEKCESGLGLHNELYGDKDYKTLLADACKKYRPKEKKNV